MLCLTTLAFAVNSVSVTMYSAATATMTVTQGFRPGVATLYEASAAPLTPTPLATPFQYAASVSGVVYVGLFEGLIRNCGHAIKLLNGSDYVNSFMERSNVRMAQIGAMELKRRKMIAAGLNSVYSKIAVVNLTHA